MESTSQVYRKMLPTTLVGSYPQPDWLIDRRKLLKPHPGLESAKRSSGWSPPEWLEQAQDDATLLTIRDQERAGLDIVTDGEIRRESYSNRFATALEGIDLENPGTVLSRSGFPDTVPRVTGRIRRKHPVQLRDVQFLRANTRNRIKITLPGPFTMSQQALNEYYATEAGALDYAAAVNEEIKDLFAAGADIVQIDEPYMQARPDKVSRVWLGRPGARPRRRHRNRRHPSLFRLRGRPKEQDQAVALRVFGGTRHFPGRPDLDRNRPARARLLGPRKTFRTRPFSWACLDLSTHEIETPEVVASRIRRALPLSTPAGSSWPPIAA